MIGIYYIMALILGLCVGSFLNVVIYRVPNGISLIKPNSHCPKCKSEIKWYDNIPILSYLILRGRCRVCKCHISSRYVFVEILNAVLWVLCVYCFYNISILLMLLYAVVCSLLLVIALIDLEHMYILDRFIIMLLIVGVVLCLFTGNVAWSSRLFGLAVGGGVMLAFYGLGFLLFKREALGIGDIKLMAVCGLIVGYKAILLAIFIGAIVGAVVLLAVAKNKIAVCGNKMQCGSVENSASRCEAENVGTNLNKNCGAKLNENSANEKQIENENCGLNNEEGANLNANASQFESDEQGGSEKQKEFPFAPFLCFGVVVAMSN